MEKINRYTFPDRVETITVSKEKGAWMRSEDVEAKLREMLEIMLEQSGDVVGVNDPQDFAVSVDVIKQIFAELGIEKGSEG